jgi:LmbE family N-acetylglucosaminyl deacetylase
VLDDDRLRDGPDEVWDDDLISDMILDCINHLVSDAAKKQHASDPKVQYNIKLLTFDNLGVSCHPNHIDTFKGVRYLFQEKAIHTRQNDTIHTCLTISDDKDKTSINLQVWVLQTISNPLDKYFFWSFWELLPHLIVLLFEWFWHLILFLLGGAVWFEQMKKPTASLLNEKQQTSLTHQYRIMEPLLAWNAMAAHHSQFVWYRRLSVMFSRYTFINNLVRLLPHESYLMDKEDKTSLPPISVIEEESPFLLDTTQMNDIREKILPPSLQLRPWKRIYSLSRDGDSFISFQKLVGDWNSKNRQHCTLLVVKTTQGEVIGGYADVPFVQTVKHPSGGGSGSCLFKVQDSDIIVYGKNSGGDKRVVLDSTRRMVGFGSGSREGSQEDGFGLCLNDGFLRGTTARCEAFDNQPLVIGRDVFEVTDVEVWGFVFGLL